MNKKYFTLLAGFVIGITTCILSVKFQLRFSPEVEKWTFVLLLFPMVFAVGIGFLNAVLGRYLLKENLREFHFRGIDIDAELERLASSSNNLHKQLIKLFYFLQAIISFLIGYFVSSIFLAAYLILN